MYLPGLAVKKGFSSKSVLRFSGDAQSTLAGQLGFMRVCPSGRRAQFVEKEKMDAVGLSVRQAGRIVAGITHEVGNPLSSISSVVQILKRAGSSGLKTEELDVIETCIQRISSFEPFFTTGEPGRGAESGLAVSYSVARKHGGSIDFSSTPGQGTLFTLRIPILNRALDG